MSNYRFKKGDRVRVIHNPDYLWGYQEVLHGEEGTVVCILFEDVCNNYYRFAQYGIDFGKRIPGASLHDLDGDIKTLTGRYFYGGELVLIESKQLEFIIDPKFEELYV